MISVVFVCLGNICRSPVAEAAFRALVGQQGLAEAISVSSAATSSWEHGNPRDARTAANAAQHGLALTGCSTQLTPEQYNAAHHVVVMDFSNRTNVLKMMGLTARQATKLRLLRQWDPNPGNGQVPDPYFGDEIGFERVYQIIARSLPGLLQHIVNTHGLTPQPTDTEDRAEQ
jgi:protein-tyrosine phosphatase